MARQFAVFDIDGTIVRTSLMQLIIKEFVNRGALDGAVAGDIERLIHDARQRISDDNFGGYMKQALDIMLQHSGGTIKLAAYNEAIDAVAHSLTTSTYVYTRQLIDTLKNNGFFLIAISGSEQRAVQAVARSLGFDACAASVYYIDDGTKLTGEVQKFTSKKDEILKTIVEKHELTSKGSLAVGDTSSDISMFEFVEQPIAFNPNQALFKTAREKGWMVVVERKDMVYGMQLDGPNYVVKSVNV